MENVYFKEGLAIGILEKKKTTKEKRKSSYFKREPVA